MAKVKFGMMMTDASGKLGGQVFSKNKAGSYVRTKVTPANPQTVYQSGVRGLFGSLSAQWGALTDQQRNSFINAVDDFKRTNIFGDLKAPTGKALFQRLNQNLVQSGQAQITEAPQVVAPPLISGITAEYSPTTLSFTVATEGDTSGAVIQTWATPVLSPGTSFIKNRIRAIDYTAGGADVQVALSVPYTNRFGDLVTGDNVYVAVRTISSTGQASPLQTVKVSYIP